MIEDTFYAFIAGLVEGEGNIGIYKCKQSKKPNNDKEAYFYTAYRLNISNTSNILLEYVKTKLGYGYISNMQSKPNCLQQYQLRFNQKEQKELYPHIIPFLISKKEKAEQSYNFVKEGYHKRGTKKT
jgi:hypothetical protein